MLRDLNNLFGAISFLIHRRTEKRCFRAYKSQQLDDISVGNPPEMARAKQPILRVCEVSLVEETVRRQII